MADLPKWLFFAGVALIAAAGLAWLANRAGFHGLPGDISYRSRHFTLYFPIVTCLALSVLLSLMIWLITWFTRR